MRYFFKFSFLAFALMLMWSCQNDHSILDSGTNSADPNFEQGAEPDHYGNWPRHSSESEELEYQITIENITPATGAGSSQPFSPPVLATHRPFFKLFKLGHYASDELRQVAEDAVNDPIVSMLNASQKVKSVTQGMDVILPGQSSTITIKTVKGYKWLSLVSMLVNTNDGFTGFSGIPLPRHGSKTFKIYAYDAGTEKNTELAANIPGPCCGSHLVRVPTHERIRFHKGIKGIGDLEPAIYDWDGAVAEVTITLMN